MLKVLTITVLFYGLGIIAPCFAAINLSVNPVDGSNSLRFERIPTAGEGKNQEIHIRVTSTDGKRYQVFQRILEPIVNEKGNALNLQAMKTQTLPNSNSSGTLYLQNSDRLSYSDQLLYTSSQSGENDSFVIGYSLDESLINASGNYRGRMVFSVRSLGESLSDQVTLDVLLQASSSFKISIKGAHNPAKVRIQGSDTTQKTADFVQVSFSGNSGQEIRIYQEIENFPQNETQEELGADVLQIDAQGDTEGLRMAGPSLLGNARTLVYSSSKEEDSFIVYFLANEEGVQKQDAGTYNGKIKYVVEATQGRQEFPVDIQCVIPPMFTMNVTMPPGGVNFPHVLSNNPPQDKEVLVTVLSNLHKPYQVLQGLQTGMTNEKGKEFDSKYFNIQVEIPSGQRGQTDYMEFSPVQTGEYPVFSSDAQGSGATFKVVYRLQGYDQMSPGNFLAPIRFSLNQK